MNIALIGYGAMGQIVHKVAKEKGFNIVSIIDITHPEAHYHLINEESLKGVDVCIDFTNPEAVLNNVLQISEQGKSIIMATTGWLVKEPKIKEIVEDSKIGFLYASNFSVGVNLFFKMVRQAAQIINQFDDYDIYSYEMHHNRKKDAPSGTALSIGGILLEEIERKRELLIEKPEGEIKKDQLHLATIRGGDIPGTHCVGFDSQADTIELKHTARNREGFALGSLLAAEWIKDKKGYFGTEEWLG